MHTMHARLASASTTSVTRASGYARCAPSYRNNQKLCARLRSVQRGAGQDDVSGPSSSARSPEYQGAYGTFSIGPDDEQEVLLYRVGINVAAAATVTCSLAAFLPEDNALRGALVSNMDVVAVAGAAGLGLSLVQIHIYMAPIKRSLQALWSVGTAGALGIMLMQEPPAALYVAQHPIAVWLIGPLFAALTGVAFKEGLCYGKLEAGLLFGATPLLLLGHLSGLVPEAGERGLLLVFCLLFSVFALRKWTQPVKDDVGDKSVFEFLALPPEQQQAAQMARDVRERGL